MFSQTAFKVHNQQDRPIKLQTQMNLLLMTIFKIKDNGIVFPFSVQNIFHLFKMSQNI